MKQTTRWLALALIIAAALLISASVIVDAATAPVAARGQEGLGAWTQIDITGLNNGTRVNAVRRDAALLLVGTRNQGIFRSADGGTEWQQVSAFSTANVRDVWLAPGGATALAATFGSGLLRSDDRGVTWSPIGQNIGTDYHYSLSAYGETLFLGTANRGVWKSADGGVTWDTTAEIASPGAVAVVAVSELIAYAGSVDNGMFKTTDGGASWQQVEFAGRTVLAVAVDPQNDAIVFASLLNAGVFVSVDGGITWAAIGDGVDSTSFMSLLVTYASGARQVLAGADSSGVYQLQDDAWTAFGMSGSAVYGLSAWNTTIYAGSNRKVWEYTSLPTPTPTNTATPGLAMFLLQSDPISSIPLDGELLYTIQYRNGPLPLAEFTISNEIPEYVSLVPDSISPGGVSNGSNPGAVVSWYIGDLAANAEASVFYRVRRTDYTLTPSPTSTVTPTPTGTPTATPTSSATSTPTATPTSSATSTPTSTPTASPTSTPSPVPALNIAAVNISSIDSAQVGDQFWYHVTVTNTSPSLSLTRLALTDYFNTQSPNNQCVAYIGTNHGSCELSATTPPSIACDIVQVFPPGVSLTVGFLFEAIAPCTEQQNANVAYVVGYSAGQQTPLIQASAYVEINSGRRGLRQNSPLAAAPFADVVIVNNGALAAWRFNGQVGETVSNQVINPSGVLYLPLMHRQ